MYCDTTASSDGEMCSSDGETDFFQTLAGVLQRNTLARYLFIINLDFALRSAINGYEQLGFTLNESHSSRYPANTITDTDCVDNISLLSDTLAEAQQLLHRIKCAAAEVALIINEEKTAFMSFGSVGDLISLSGTKLNVS